MKKSLLFIAFTLLFMMAYGHTLDVPFTLDDHLYIANNNAIQSQAPLKEIWQLNASRSLLFLSFHLNYRIHQLNVGGYHFTNLLIHFLCCVTVFFILVELFRRYKVAPYFELAFLLTCIFAFHPLQTQAVTYIWQRASLLVAFFGLLSILFWLLARRPQENLMYFIFSWGFAFLAMFCKQNAAPLPLILVTTDLLLFPKGSRRKTLYACFLPLCAIVPALTFLAKTPEIRDIITSSEWRLSSWEYFFTQTYVLKTYLRLFFFPINQNLDYFYPEYRAFNIYIVFNFIFFATVSFLISKIHRLCILGILIFILSHSIESSFLPLPDTIFEHRMYFPMLGILMVFAGLYARCPIPFTYRNKTALAMATLIFVLTVSTHLRNETWASEEQIWSDISQKSFGKVRAHINYGNILLQKNKNEEAKFQFEQALEGNPQSILALSSLAKIHLQRNELNRAAFLLEKATRIPSDPILRSGMLNNLAYVYEDLGKTHLAIGAYQKALQLNPRLSPARKRLRYLTQTEEPKMGK